MEDNLQEMFRRISLLPTERKLFDFLRHCARNGAPTPTLRVAGGWVRDKLMGRECSDIDIALDNMYGREFARRCVSMLPAYAPEAKHAHVAVIAANPEQSKHLEAATVKLFGLEVDFVNLRSETYADHSRIPTAIGFGTVHEDAMRRDLTINALFYNITDECVEDPTGRGLSDMESRIIRTPLDPHTTFDDDPLRVLRAVRFGARFGYTFDEALVRAAQREETRVALASKVSRERIGKELAGMFRRNVVRALDIVESWHLMDVVFAVPTDSIQRVGDAPPFDASTEAVPGEHHDACMDALRRYEQRADALGDALTAESMARVFASLMYPLRRFTCAGAKKRRETVPFSVLVRSLKFGSHVGDAVNSILAHVDEWQRVGDAILGDASQVGPVECGLLVRSNGGKWRESVRVAAALRADENCVEWADKVVTHVEALGVAEAYSMKPRINGRDAQSLFKVKPGKILSVVADACIRWQLEHPNGGDDALQAHVADVIAAHR